MGGKTVMGLINFGSVALEKPMLIAIICGGALCLVVLALAIAYFTLRRRYKRISGSQTTAEPVRVKNGVRYSINERTLKSDGAVKAGLTESDKLLVRGREYTVGKKGDLLPGKYTALSSDEGVESINVRVAGFVRSVKHMDALILNDGDKICAVSHPLILR